MGWGVDRKTGARLHCWDACGVRSLVKRFDGHFFPVPSFTYWNSEGKTLCPGRSLPTLTTAEEANTAYSAQSTMGVLMIDQSIWRKTWTVERNRSGHGKSIPSNRIKFYVSQQKRRKCHFDRSDTSTCSRFRFIVQYSIIHETHVHPQRIEFLGLLGLLGPDMQDWKCDATAIAANSTCHPHIRNGPCL